MRFLVTLIILCFYLSSFSQKNQPYEYNFVSYQKYFKEEVGVTIKIPKKFKQNLDKYFQYWTIIEDKNCMIALPYDNYTTLYLLKNRKEYDKNFYFYIKGQLIAEILTALGLCNYSCGRFNNKTEKKEVYKYVEVVFGKKAKEKHNASAYAIFDIPNAHKTHFFDKDLENLRKEKYPFCTSLFIQNDDSAVLDFKLYFTEKGFKKKENILKC